MNDSRHSHFGGARRPLMLLVLAALFIVPAMPASAASTDFTVVLDQSAFFELSGRTLNAGYTVFNYKPVALELSFSATGTGLTITPAQQTLNITAGGRYEGKFCITASTAGEYFITAIATAGDQVFRDTSSVNFLPPISCKFVSPVTNERNGVVGAGQTYVGKVNVTNWGSSTVAPTFALPGRDLASGTAGTAPTELVTMNVGDIAPGASKVFSYDGLASKDMGSRTIVPVVKSGDKDITYGFVVGPAGIFNVTLLQFTLQSRELLGIELSSDQFVLGQKSSIIMYVECRRAGGTLGGSLNVSLKTDIEARAELSDYAAEPRFEEFIGHVKSMVDHNKHYGLPVMEAGVQELYQFEFYPKICRGTADSGGSFFLQLSADFGGVRSTVSKPISVSSPLVVELESHEKMNYASMGELVTRRLTVRNTSNQTVQGATASFFLDFKEKGAVSKSAIMDMEPVSIPTLGPGEEASVALSVNPRSPGTYVLFPVVKWGGLEMYGSEIRIAASGSGAVPVGSYVTVILVIAIAAGLTRKFTP